MLTEQQLRTALIGSETDLRDLVDLKGASFEGSEYAGKVVLLDFWATWCVPCLEEIPNLRQVHKQHSPDGFDVIGINIDENLESAQQFIESQDLPWKNFRFRDAPGFDAEFLRQHGIKAISRLSCS